MRLTRALLGIHRASEDLAYWNSFLSLLDPVHVKVFGARSNRFRCPRTVLLPAVNRCFLDRWTRLKSAIFTGATVFVREDGEAAFAPLFTSNEELYCVYRLHQREKGRKSSSVETLDHRNPLEALGARWKHEKGPRTHLILTSERRHAPISTSPGALSTGGEHHQ